MRPQHANVEINFYMAGVLEAGSVSTLRGACVCVGVFCGVGPSPSPPSWSNLPQCFSVLLLAVLIGAERG